ncbi:MAG TPA: hypothetical protein RMH99_14560 [Sandaracinaceae bacterium LLY-WYZ-13_1]|nr:hypothetical protein [Sandaracinaceae bacterium LLY-WYZ-13_1]
MISRKPYAHIRRLYFAEHWKVGTIAKELGLHADTVERTIEIERFGTRVETSRRSMLDPYRPFALGTLDKHPTARRRMEGHGRQVALSQRARSTPRSRASGGFGTGRLARAARGRSTERGRAAWMCGDANQGCILGPGLSRAPKAL